MDHVRSTVIVVNGFRGQFVIVDGIGGEVAVEVGIIGNARVLMMGWHSIAVVGGVLVVIVRHFGQLKMAEDV